MSIPTDTLWPLAPHTKAKHEILEKYLAAWFAILGKSCDRLVYIDGFCGPGKYKDGEPGSPIIANKQALGNKRNIKGQIIFWFIDKRQDRINHLKQYLDGFKLPENFFIIPEQGEFREKFKLMMDYVDGHTGAPAPIFCFIDPFGFGGIPFNLIKRLLKYQRCEVFVTIMVDSINRFLEHPNNEVAKHIVDVFGTEEAISIANSSRNRVERLRGLYQSQLESIANYVRYFQMQSEQNRPQYYLFFATNHRMGHLKMKEAMWKVDAKGEFVFSDTINSNQMELLNVESTTTPILREKMRNYFSEGIMISCSEIRQFVEDQTPYLKKHMDVALKEEEDDGGIIVEEHKIDGKKRFGKSFQNEVLLKFVKK